MEVWCVWDPASYLYGGEELGSEQSWLLPWPALSPWQLPLFPFRPVAHLLLPLWVMLLPWINVGPFFVLHGLYMQYTLFLSIWLLNTQEYLQILVEVYQSLWFWHDIGSERPCFFLMSNFSPPKTVLDCFFYGVHKCVALRQFYGGHEFELSCNHFFAWGAVRGICKGNGNVVVLAFGLKMLGVRSICLSFQTFDLFMITWEILVNFVALLGRFMYWMHCFFSFNPIGLTILCWKVMRKYIDNRHRGYMV